MRQLVMTRVFVTGLGVVSSLGFGREAFWEAVTQGRTGFSPIESFDSSQIGRNIAGEVKNFRARDFLSAAERRRMGRCSAYAVAASRMAVDDAGLAPEEIQGERTAVILGTTMGEADVMAGLEDALIRHGEEAVDVAKLPRYGTTLLPIHVARAFGATGMVQTLPAACAAGNYAIGHASDLIRAGKADVAIAGASEILQKIQFAGFVRLGAVAPERCQPFDKNRKGLIIGEGAGILILESEAHLVARGGVQMCSTVCQVGRPH